MPAVSKRQRRFMAMCEHDPGAARGKCPNMTKSQMHDFAVTKEKKLPYSAKSTASKIVKRIRGS